MPSNEQHLDLQRIGDVTVVKFLGRDFLCVDEVEVIRNRLFALAKEESRRRFVLDFLNVQSLGSSFLEMFIRLWKLISAKGQLRCCNMSPVVIEVFATTGDCFLRAVSPGFWPTGNLKAALQSIQDEPTLPLIASLRDRSTANVSSQDGPALPLIASLPLSDAETADAVRRILAEWESAHS